MTRPKYSLGLVVGKFAPLHLGHEWLIHEAEIRCERLLILSYSNPEFEACGVAMRREWLRSRFPTHSCLVIDDAWLLHACAASGVAFSRMPHNSADDATQQAFLAWLLKDVLRQKPDAMFCSESYGAPCAERLSVELGHLVKAEVFDTTRAARPMRASLIRRHPHRYSTWMAPEVAHAFTPRIALLGGESSGKSTLAATLARHFGTAWVPEFGREHWDAKGGVFDADDFLLIARTQIAREEAMLCTATDYLFCDTTPLTTLGYSGWMQQQPDAELERMAQRRYDGVVLCAPDFDFVQDGTRRDTAFRMQQHAWYLQRLKALQIPVVLAEGCLEQRLSTVARWLEATLSESARHGPEGRHQLLPGEAFARQGQRQPEGADGVGQQHRGMQPGL